MQTPLEIDFPGIAGHRNSGLGGKPLVEGARTTVVEEAGERGPQASTVKLLGKHAMRP